MDKIRRAKKQLELLEDALIVYNIEQRGSKRKPDKFIVEDKEIEILKKKVKSRIRQLKRERIREEKKEKQPPFSPKSNLSDYFIK